MTDTDNLAALDEKATPGVWIRHNSPKKWVSTLAPVSDEEWRENCDNDAQFVLALVNAYRANALVPHTVLEEVTDVVRVLVARIEAAREIHGAVIGTHYGIDATARARAFLAKHGGGDA